MVPATSATDRHEGIEVCHASTDLLLDGTVVQRLDGAIGSTFFSPRGKGRGTSSAG